MATHDEILEALKQSQAGLRLNELSQAVGHPANTLTKPLKALRSKGYVSHSDDGLYTITPDGEKSLTEPSQAAPQFLDTEGRFNSLLKSYGIKDGERIVSYISTQGENVYSDLETLRRCLVEQGVAAGKTNPIVKHWAAIEQLPIPQRLLGEIGAETPSGTAAAGARGGRRFMVLDAQIHNMGYESPEFYTMAEGVMKLQTERTTQPKDSEIEAVKQELVRLREDKYLSAITTLNQRIDKWEEEMRQPRSVGQKGAGDILMEMVNKMPDRSDLRALPMEFAKAMRESEKLAVPRSPQERESELAGMEGKIKDRAELTRIENWLLFGEDRAPALAPAPPAKPQPAAQPAPQPVERVVYE